MPDRVAFGGALLLSFVGHCRWTFRLQGRPPAVARSIDHRGRPQARTDPLIAYEVAHRLRWHYAYAIVAMVTSTPVALFLSSWH